MAAVAAGESAEGNLSASPSSGADSVRLERASLSEATTDELAGAAEAASTCATWAASLCRSSLSPLASCDGGNGRCGGCATTAEAAEAAEAETGTGGAGNGPPKRGLGVCTAASAGACTPRRSESTFCTRAHRISFALRTIVRPAWSLQSCHRTVSASPSRSLSRASASSFFTSKNASFFLMVSSSLAALAWRSSGVRDWSSCNFASAF
mmetsp:Transcript_2665/g.5773  ORF Transcript_2665/g.5773 Transcript_2665/m.5773 type:complete len:209 (-) Transcript_2665:1277-1903(-)